ncbi:MAG: WD40/YVTN/BNR-like repeat-containing protein, partial [Bacteroidota bacterium]
MFLWSGCEFNPTKTAITEDYNSITWTQNRELTNGNIHCLAENPQGDLFCGSDQNVYKSTDGGASWEVSSDINDRIYSIVCVTNNVMFASTLTDIYKSSDNGKNWTHWKAIMLDNCWIEKMVMYDDYWILVATSGRGLLKMGVQVRSWEQLQTVSDYFQNIFIDPDNHDIIYACNAPGAERSEDGGVTWTKANFPNDVYTKTNCMLKLSDSVLIAGSNFVDYGQSAKMFKSTDNGLNWEVMEITGENLGTGIFSMVQAENDRIYAGFSISHDYGEKCGVYYSDDEGKS